ncbi:MAG: Cytochrome oxidase Cu insertion factor, SCO1/SenC/PrrC family [Chloroflexi bacterium]|nr:MAG: Cytochrome oxidase Cu insertion factor, SCO1/SenC/PrrC family [Chloroflexota bacterium]
MAVKIFRLNLQLRFIYLIVVLLIMPGCNSVRDNTFLGTVLSKSPKAMDFSLVDQFGQSVRLSEFQNKVVVLTFVYTSCNEICPSIALKLKDSERYLVDQTDEISTLLISVDPRGDTLNNTQKFLQDYGMVNKWKYLVGTEAELKPVWDAYYVSTAVKEVDTSLSESASKDEFQIELLQNYSVTHQGPVYIIDRTGHARSVFTLPFDPEDLANDIKLLLDEN